MLPSCNILHPRDLLIPHRCYSKMAPSTPENETLKEVLETLKQLQINQIQLASTVDAISGRVNVLAGMKEVRDVAESSEILLPSGLPATEEKVEPTSQRSSVDLSRHVDDVVPPSPSIPATHIDGEASPTSQVSHVKKQSVTSRIILT